MINNALYASVVGAEVSMRRLDVLANNLANVATPGYKLDRTSIRSDQTHISSHDFDRFRTLMKDSSPLVGVTTAHTQGAIQTTNRDLDLAIQGEGFFELDGPDGPVYSRSGVFRVDREGFLTGAAGYRVLGEGGPIQINDGRVTVRADGQVDVDGEEVDKLQVVTFEDSRGLQKGAGTVFTKASPELESRPAVDFQIVQGSLEMSNVSAIRAMSELIETQRTFDSGMQNIRMINQLNQKMVANVTKTK